MTIITSGLLFGPPCTYALHCTQWLLRCL